MLRLTFTGVLLLLCVNIHAQIEIINNPEWGLWQNREDTVLSFELIQVYGTDFPDESAVFSSTNRIWTVTTDNVGHVYVLDIDVPMLVKFTEDGNVLWKLDQEGKGPGDLFVPNGLAVGDSLYLSNVSGTRLDVFDNNGRFIRTLNTDHVEMRNIQVLGIIDDRYLVLHTFLSGEIGVEFSILDINEGYQKAFTFKAIEEVDFEIPSGGYVTPKTSIIDGLIVMSKFFSYGYQYYDLDGTLVKEINRDFSGFVRPGFATMGNRPVMMPLGELHAPHKVKKDYLLNYLLWPSNIEDPDKAVAQFVAGNRPALGIRSSLDLFSPKGQLLYSIENDGLIPDIGWIKHANDEGYLYTVHGDPYPQVRKYKVNVREQ